MQNDIFPNDRNNSFNVLRLVFASLVIVTHSYAIYDAHAERDLLYRLTGTLSFGEISVDGFFLLSGYLITKSYFQSRSIWDYLWKRILRIYPAFLICYLICVTLVAFLADAQAPDTKGFFKLVTRALLLAPPTLDSEFPGFPVHALNGSAWTIAYEFRCYLLVGILGVIGLLKRRTVILGLALMLVLFDWIGPPSLGARFPTITGDLESGVRFSAFFLVGASYYLYRDRIIYNRSAAVIATMAMLGVLFLPGHAETGLMLFGSYALFWLALKGPGREIGSRLTTDISYGLYLYGWPVQSLLIYYIKDIAPLFVTLAALPLSALLGWLSWTWLEQPLLALKRRSRQLHDQRR